MDSWFVGYKNWVLYPMLNEGPVLSGLISCATHMHMVTTKLWTQTKPKKNAQAAFPKAYLQAAIPYAASPAL